MTEQEIEKLINRFKLVSQHIYYDEAVVIGSIVGELVTEIKRLKSIGGIEMSSFICEECGCIDNTATNNSYWGRNFEDMFDDTRILCQECSPRFYKNGKPVPSSSTYGEVGTWHDRFPKTHWTDIGKECILEKYRLGNGSYINAKEFFALMEDE